MYRGIKERVSDEFGGVLSTFPRRYESAEARRFGQDRFVYLETELHASFVPGARGVERREYVSHWLYGFNIVQ